MQLGKIIGTVTATRKDENLVSSKLMIVQPVNEKQENISTAIVAVDTVGAGIGELIFFVTGSVAYHAFNEKACDAAILGIVDNISLMEVL